MLDLKSVTEQTVEVINLDSVKASVQLTKDGKGKGGRRGSQDASLTHSVSWESKVARIRNTSEA